MKKRIDNPKILIGAKLKDARKSMGLTQEEVAETLGLAPRYISDIERDKTKGSITTLISLCNMYQVSPTFILRDYLSNENIDFDESLLGFQTLSSAEKSVIKKLITFMNENKKNVLKNNFTNESKQIKKRKIIFLNYKEMSFTDILLFSYLLY